MIRYLKHTEIDKTNWGESLKQSYNRVPYALSWFLDIVSPGWDALVLEDYKELMPLTHKRRLGISYICQPLFCHRLGVFSTLRKDAFPIDDYLAAIPEKFRLIDLPVNEKNLIMNENKQIYIQNKFFQKLYTKPTHENLKEQYSRSHLKNIRRFSNKTEHTISFDFTAQDFHTMKMKSLKENKVRLSGRNSRLHQHLLTELERRNILDIRIGLNKTTVLGGICAYRTEFNSLCIQSFLTREGKKSGIIFYLIDQLISENAEQEMQIDFMGSTLPGVQERNLGFGSKEESYSFIRIKRLRGPYHFLKRGL